MRLRCRPSQQSEGTAKEGEEEEADDDEHDEDAEICVTSTEVPERKAEHSAIPEERQEQYPKSSAITTTRFGRRIKKETPRVRFSCNFFPLQVPE